MEEKVGMKKFAPFLVNLYNRDILIVGGGNVALLKARGIFRFTSQITVVSPQMISELESYPFSFCKQEYTEGLVDNFFMVYVCTNNTLLNRKIGEECERKNILYSVCDDPEVSSFASPAIYKNKEITIAVGTNGSNPRLAMNIRNQIEQLVKDGFLKIDND